MRYRFWSHDPVIILVDAIANAAFLATHDKDRYAYWLALHNPQHNLHSWFGASAHWLWYHDAIPRRRADGTQGGKKRHGPNRSESRDPRALQRRILREERI
jgi:hypothetical protein